MLVFIIALGVMVAAVYGVISYRDLAQMQRDIAVARQEINEYIIKRHELIPELLSWVQDHGIGEKDIQDLEQAAKRVHRVHHRSSLKELGEAETVLRRQFGALFSRLQQDEAIYQDKGFARLQKRITAVQIIIAERSESYNRLVNENNRRLQRMPDSWLKDYFRFEVAECLQFQEGDAYTIEFKGMYA